MEYKQRDNWFTRNVLSESMSAQVKRWITFSSIANVGLGAIYTALYLLNAKHGDALEVNIPFPFYFLCIAPFALGMSYDMTKEHLRKGGIGLGLGGSTYDEQHDWFLVLCIKMFLVMTAADTAAQFFGWHAWHSTIDFLYVMMIHFVK